MENQIRESKNQEKVFDTIRQQRIQMIKNTFILILVIESVVIAKFLCQHIIKCTHPIKVSCIDFGYPFITVVREIFVLKISKKQNQARNICSNLSYQEKYHDVYCYNTSTMNIIRYVLSSILIFIILLMFFDIYRIIKIKNSLNNRILSQDLVNQAEKFQIVITLLLAIYYGILMIFIFVVDGEYGSALGLSFYVGGVGTVIYMIIIIYSRYVRGRFSRTTYFENCLTNNQMNQRYNKIMNLKLSKKKKKVFIQHKNDVIQFI